MNNIPFRLPRGPKANIPELKEGVPAFARDTNELLIGSKTGNTEFKSKSPKIFEDAIYSWWINPLALRYVDEYDKTYFGWVDFDGYVWIASFNHESGDINKFELGQVSKDDHNAPAIVPPAKGSDQGFTVFYTGHNDDEYIYYRVSENHEDITSWGEEKTIEFSDVVTYCQAYRLDNYQDYQDGKDDTDYSQDIHLLTRVGGGSNSVWTYRLSEDNGETWEPEQPFIDGTWVYIISNHKENESLIRLAIGDHPINGEVQNIYIGLIYLKDGEVKAPRQDPDVIGNVRDGTDLPLSMEDFVEVYSADTDNDEMVRLFSVSMSDLMEIGFCSFYENEEGELEDAQYKYLIWDGVSYISDLGDPGIPIEEPAGENYYFGGIWFETGIERGTLYLSREKDGNWYIEKWRTKNDGYTWEVETIEKTTDGTKLFRPYGIKNHVNDLELMYCKGMYEHFSDPHNWDTDMLAPVTEQPTLMPGIVGSYNIPYGMGMIESHNLWEEDPENGYFIKYVDGRLECFGVASTTTDTGQDYAHVDIDLPESYKDENYFVYGNILTNVDTKRPYIFRTQPREKDKARISVSTQAGEDWDDSEELRVNYRTMGFWDVTDNNA